MHHKFISIMILVTLFGSVPIYSCAYADDAFTLFEQAMQNHSQCRKQLDKFVKRSATELQSQPIVVRDNKNVLGNKDKYVLLIRPNNDEIMTFECNNENLKIWYRFL